MQLAYLMFGERATSWLPVVCSHELLQPLRLGERSRLMSVSSLCHIWFASYINLKDSQVNVYVPWSNQKLWYCKLSLVCSVCHQGNIKSLLIATKMGERGRGQFFHLYQNLVRVDASSESVHLSPWQRREVECIWKCLSSFLIVSCWFFLHACHDSSVSSTSIDNTGCLHHCATTFYPETLLVLLREGG